MIMLSEQVQAKWKEVLEHEDMPAITDRHRRVITAQVLENTETALSEYRDHSQFMLHEAAPTNSMGTSSSTAGAGNIDTFDPIIMSLLRRSMPNLIAYELAGVQAMTGPTGLIFAMRTRYANQVGQEAFQHTTLVVVLTLSQLKVWVLTQLLSSQKCRSPLKRLQSLQSLVL